MAYPKRLSRPLAAAISAMALLAPAALAQSTTGTDPANTHRVDAAEGFGSSDASGGVFGEGGNAFDLIHRVTLMNGTTIGDFSRQHRGRMSSEAANFQALREAALRRQAQSETLEIVPDTGAE